MWGNLAAGLIGYQLGNKKHGGGSISPPSLLTQGTQTARSLKLNELQKALAISQGRLQPWELPEYRPMVQERRATTDRTLSQMPAMMAKSGITGPGAGLAMERVATGGQNADLNLINQIRTQSSDRGLSLASGQEASYQNMSQMMAAAKAQREQLKWKKIMDMLGLGVQGVKMTAGAVAGGMSGGLTGGLGA